MIRATSDDKLRWALQIATTKDAQGILAVMDKIWQDGYQCGEVHAQLEVGHEQVK